MLKYLSLLLLIFLAYNAKCQIYSDPNPGLYGIKYNRIRPGIVLHLPVKTANSVDTNDPTAQIYVKNDSVWLYSNGTHKNLSGATGITPEMINNWNAAYGWGDHHGLYQPLENQRLSTTNNVRFASTSVSNLSIDGLDPFAYFGDASFAGAPVNGARLYSIGGKMSWNSRGGSEYDRSFVFDNSGLNSARNYVLPNYDGKIVLSTFSQANALAVFDANATTISAANIFNDGAGNWNTTGRFGQYGSAFYFHLAPVGQPDVKASIIAPSNAGANYDYQLPGGSGTIALKSDIDNAVGNYIPITDKAVANGVATLDAQSKIPMTQIPDALVGSVKYVDVYDASTNTPALPAADASNKGWYYIVNVAGSQQGLSLNKNDWVISNGMKWDKVDNNNLITSVFGRVGPITAQVNDYSSFYLPYTGGTMTGPVNFLSDGVNKLKLETFSGGTAHVFVGDNGTIGTDISGSDVKLNSVAFRYGSYRARVTANTLTADREILLPDKNGTIALADGSNATGTWPVNISGTSNNSSQWGTVPQNFAVLPSGTPKYLIGIDGSDVARYWNNTAVLNWLGLPPINPGGETLQSVTNRGSFTTKGITFATPNPAWDQGLDITVQGKNNRATIQSHNAANTSPQDLDINPYGGSVVVGSPTAGTYGLTIYGGSTPAAYPTLGQFSGGFRLANIDGQYGLDAGVNTDGNTWMQAGRSDGTATPYNLIFNPKGGNMGIGKINPTSKLDVAGGINADGIIFSNAALFSNRNVPEGGALYLQNTSKTGTAASQWVLYNMTGAYGDGLKFWKYAADGGSNTGAAFTIWDNGPVQAGSFVVSPTVDITSSNTFKVNASQPAGTALAYINNTNNVANTYGLIVNTAATDAGSQIFSARSNSVDRFTIASNGNVGFGTVSPARQIEEWNNGAVEFLMTDASQPTDLKRWRMFNASQNLKFGYTNDAMNNATDVLVLSRGSLAATFSGRVSASDAVNATDLVAKQQLTLDYITGNSANPNANQTSNALIVSGSGRNNAGNNGALFYSNSSTVLQNYVGAAVKDYLTLGDGLSTIVSGSTLAVNFYPMTHGTTAEFGGRVKASDPINSSDLTTKNYVDNATNTTSGTWTPVIQNVTGYTVFNASWAKSGKVVTITLLLEISSSATTSAGTTNFYISGMPLFGSSPVGSITTTGKLFNTSSSTTAMYFYETGYNGSQPYWVGMTGTNTTTPASNNDILGFGGGGAKRIQFQMSYQIM